MAEVIYFVDTIELWTIIIGVAIFLAMAIIYLVYLTSEFVKDWLRKRRFNQLQNKKV